MITAQTFDKILALAIFVVIATYLMYPFFKVRTKKQSHEEPHLQVQPEAAEVVVQPQYAPVFMAREEIVAPPLIVRDLTDKATLLVRHRMMKRACTAQLIIWSGAKRKRISDSYYDLGVIEGVEPSEAIVGEFMVMARDRLNELAQEGKRKRRCKAVPEVQQEVATTAVIQSVVSQNLGDAGQDYQCPQVVVEDTPPESIRLKKFPSVYRGVITDIGMMDQCKNGEEFSTFGVRYRTLEGIEDAVFGANLRNALREADASIGDTVEIVKIGRKTIDPKRAPMNLFKVAKLAAATA